MTRSAGEPGGAAMPPALFATIVGQPGAVALLQRAVERGRVAHAYAFIGPPGVGRRLAARALGQACLCAQGGCGTCSACRRVAADQHPDCRIVEPLATRDHPRSAPALRIEQIRELEHWAALSPLEGRCKVAILDEVERMTAPTAHALLKTLEEPPPRTLVVLIVANPRRLPATVLSRCQPVRFRPLARAETAALLGAAGTDPETASLLAQLCRGQVGVALRTDLAAVRAQRAAALDLLEVPPARLAVHLDQASPDRAAVASYLETYFLWYRDALCLAAGGDPGLVINGDRQADVAAVARRTPLEALVRALAAVREAWLALEGNLNPRLALERTLLELGAGAAAGTPER